MTVPLKALFIITIITGRVVQLVAKKTGTVRMKLTHFYNFFILSKFNEIFRNHLISSRQLIGKWTKPNLH
jgi:hypothetical protein